MGSRSVRYPLEFAGAGGAFAAGPALTKATSAKPSDKAAIEAKMTVAWLTIEDSAPSYAATPRRLHRPSPDPADPHRPDHHRHRTPIRHPRRRRRRVATTPRWNRSSPSSRATSSTGNAGPPANSCAWRLTAAGELGVDPPPMVVGLVRVLEDLDDERFKSLASLCCR